MSGLPPQPLLLPVGDPMTDLAAWLLEQITEDETNAREAAEQVGAPTWEQRSNNIVTSLDRDCYVVECGEVEVLVHIEAWDPARVLAECEAKRRIIDHIFGYEARIDGEWGCCHTAGEIRAGLCVETSGDRIEALRIMALPYADRPGYREEWRP